MRKDLNVLQCIITNIKYVLFFEFYYSFHKHGIVTILNIVIGQVKSFLKIVLGNLFHITSDILTLLNLTFEYI